MAKWKGALVGYGFIGAKGHVPAYLQRKDVEIIAVADINKLRCAQAEKVLPGARIYSNYLDLLEKEKLDFIDIATPPCDHAEISIAALERGIHVLCEKPLAVSGTETRQMLLAAQEKKRVLFPCHNYKHAPVVKTINEIIRSGQLGEVHSLTLQTYRTTHAKGVEEWKTDWRRDRKFSGGGIAMDHGSHTFYLTFHWLQQYPTEVTAKTFQMAPNFDTEDNLTCTLSFPKGFAHGHLSWTAGVRKAIYSVHGTQGALFVDNDDVQLWVGLQKPRLEKSVIPSDWMDASHTKWFNSMFDQFLDCIRREEYVNQELKESYLCIEIIEKAYASSEAMSTAMPIDTSFSFLKEK